MLHTTLAMMERAGARTKYRMNLVKALGGIRRYGADTPIPLTKILEINGLEDALRALEYTIESSADLRAIFACDCADRVLHFYEEKYPHSLQPRRAIEARRRCIADKSSAARNEAQKAGAIVYAMLKTIIDEVAASAAGAAVEAAWDNAASAAGGAAWTTGLIKYGVGRVRWLGYEDEIDKAGDEERSWQTQHFVELLTDSSGQV
jgi:hypothetical protein